jgi:hypothetical protein
MDNIHNFAISALGVNGSRLLQPQYTMELAKELFDSYKRMQDVQQVRILKGNFKLSELCVEYSAVEVVKEYNRGA